MTKHLGILIALIIGFAPASWAAAELKIDVKIKPAGTFQAVTKKIKGFAYKTEDGVAASHVLVDLRALDTGIKLRDQHLKKYLEVEKYPIAKLEKASGIGGKGTGTIAIKGLNQEVSGTYKVSGRSLEAKFKMKLSDLKITGVRYMGAGVADDVLVTITLPIQDPPPEAIKKEVKDETEQEEE